MTHRRIVHSGSNKSTNLCHMRLREPDPETLKRIGLNMESQRVYCDICSDWYIATLMMLTTRLYLLALEVFLIYESFNFCRYIQ